LRAESLGGEAAAGLDDLADLAVERFDRVGGVDDAAQVGREGQERHDLFQCSIQEALIIG
jgi:hypothetical protein